MGTTESYPFFDQRIDAVYDAHRRVTHMVFTGYHGPTLDVDYSKARGTYSDGSYCAETFDRGRVQEVHLHELAGERGGAGIDEWVEASIARLHSDVAVFRVDFWLSAIRKQPDREQELVQSASRSYERTLTLLGEEVESRPGLFVVGWAVSRLAQGHDIPRAEGLLAGVWPDVCKRLWQHGPLISKLLATALTDDRVMALSVGRGEGFGDSQADEAIAELKRVGDQTYEAMKRGPIPDRIDETRRCAALEHDLISMWLRDGPELPEGRATSMGDANYIACLRDRGEMERAADYFRAATADRRLLRARYRDYGVAAGTLMNNGIGACLDSGRPSDLAEILALEQWMGAEGWELGGDVEYGLACTYARLGRSGEALDHLRACFSHEGKAALRGWATKDQDLRIIHGDPRFQALIRGSGS